jgi:hypothetical protein
MSHDAASGQDDVASLLERAGSGLRLELAGARVIPLAGDGSDRRFYRIRKGRLHFVALSSPRQAGREIDENDSYHRIGSHLHGRGIPVPRFFWSDPGNGWYLLEDLGDIHLQRYAERGVADLPLLYGRAVRLLAAMHRRIPEGFRPDFCFDTAVYDPPFVHARELEYFRKAFLVAYAGLDASPEELRHDFENLAEAAGVHESSMVIHRDFQSRNIMVRNGALRLLDFQGMRFGPLAYDLASLLVDPYVALPRDLQEGLVGLYWSSTGKAMHGSFRRFMESYRAVRLCRNLQALGAYGYLGLVKGKTRFFRYIPRGWQQLRYWLAGPCKDRYPALQKCVAKAHGLMAHVKREIPLGRRQA